jgi:PTS system N-acetylglucosamine-specific IIC component
LTLKDASIIDEAAIKRLGAAGVLKPNNKNIQIVVGTHAELIAEEMKKMR